MNCCNNKNIIYDKLNFSYICINCGSLHSFINNMLTYDEMNNRIYKTYYKRQNYMSELISYINGKPPLNTINLDHIIILVKYELKKELTYQNIRRFLKVHKFNKYYKYINYIINKIENKNNNNMIINYDLKLRILSEFRFIERICQKHKISNRKKKLISYSFILYKIFIKLKLNHLIRYIHYPLYTKNNMLNNIWNNYIKNEYGI